MQSPPAGEALPPPRAGKYQDWGRNTQPGRLLRRMCSLGWARGLPTARWPEGTKELVTLNKPCPSDASSVWEPGPGTPFLPLCSEPGPTLSNGPQRDHLGTVVSPWSAREVSHLHQALCSQFSQQAGEKGMD